MKEITVIGLDLAKSVFQVHGVDAEGHTVLKKCLGLPDKTRAEGDEASGQLNPAEKSLGGAIQPAAEAAELGEEVVAAFHRLPHLPPIRFCPIVLS